MDSVRSYGVYDVVNHQLQSGNNLCSTIGHDNFKSFPDDPTVANGWCYYGGQVDPFKGDCAAPSDVFAGNRRICPCSQLGKEPDSTYLVMVTLFKLYCNSPNE